MFESLLACNWHEEVKFVRGVGSSYSRSVFLPSIADWTQTIREDLLHTSTWKYGAVWAHAIHQAHLFFRLACDINLDQSLVMLLFCCMNILRRSAYPLLRAVSNADGNLILSAHVSYANMTRLPMVMISNYLPIPKFIGQMILHSHQRRWSDPACLLCLLHSDRGSCITAVTVWQCAIWPGKFWTANTLLVRSTSF